MDKRFVLALLAAVVAVLLLPDTPPASAGALAPPLDGDFVYASDRDGNAEIYLRERLSHTERRLTNNSVADTEPNWSPNGEKIAFVRAGSVHVMNADGSGAVQLTLGGSDSGPSWSPLGDKIAFSRGLGAGNRDIFVMNADGSGATNITTHFAQDVNPDWSPDGSQIVFQSDRTGDREVYVMGATGLAPTNISDTAGFDGEPVWHPRLGRIAFTSDRDGDAEIFAMDADGANVTQLTSNSDFDAEPAWAPGGVGLIFKSDRDGNDEIYGIAPVAQYRITTNAASEFSPDWQPLSNAGTGDVDCSKTVTAVDVTLILQYDASLVHSLPCLVNGHANDDAYINSLDAVVILQYIAGLLPSLPP